MIDLQKEFIDLIDDHYDQMIVRHFSYIKCNCWREESQTPDRLCPNCGGYGYIYKEFIQKGKIFRSSDLLSYYCPVDKTDSHSEVSISIKKGDILYEIRVDPGGNIVYPIQRLKRWSVSDVQIHRADTSKPQLIEITANPLAI